MRPSRESPVSLPFSCVIWLSVDSMRFFKSCSVGALADIARVATNRSFSMRILSDMACSSRREVDAAAATGLMKPSASR